MKKMLFTLLVVFGLSTVASAQITKTVTTTTNANVGVAVPTKTRAVVVTSAPQGNVVVTKKVARHRPRRHRHVVRKTVITAPVVSTKVETTTN